MDEVKESLSDTEECESTEDPREQNDDSGDALDNEGRDEIKCEFKTEENDVICLDDLEEEKPLSIETVGSEESQDLNVSCCTGSFMDEEKNITHNREIINVKEIGDSLSCGSSLVDSQKESADTSEIVTVEQISIDEQEKEAEIITSQTNDGEKETIETQFVSVTELEDSKCKDSASMEISDSNILFYNDVVVNNQESEETTIVIPLDDNISENKLHLSTKNEELEKEYLSMPIQEEATIELQIPEDSNTLDLEDLKTENHSYEEVADFDEDDGNITDDDMKLKELQLHREPIMTRRSKLVNTNGSSEIQPGEADEIIETKPDNDVSCQTLLPVSNGKRILLNSSEESYEELLKQRKRHLNRRTIAEIEKYMHPQYEPQSSCKITRTKIYRSKTVYTAPEARSRLYPNDMVYYRGILYQIGDVCSTEKKNNPGKIHYCQITAILTDQYCNKSATVQWLTPKTVDIQDDFFFDPSKYNLGYLDELPRPLDALWPVKRCPPTYFLMNGIECPKTMPECLENNCPSYLHLRLRPVFHKDKFVDHSLPVQD